ncbi:hypothetical protein QE152_g7162 [Popillia japonica]|uniref:PiggyBac transposable element-derived protein domain-containing protein n=1 Tax=Popillia japonica TaxID=7064 RepID=A0AAW1MFK5_POPJA
MVLKPQRSRNGTPKFLGKDGTPWLKHLPLLKATINKRQNIVTKLTGVLGDAQNKFEIVDCSKIISPMNVLEDIVRFINQKLDEIRDIDERTRDCVPTNLEEVEAFLGLLYLSGVKRGLPTEKRRILSKQQFWNDDSIF